MFFLMSFLFHPLWLECSRIRKTASCLTLHRHRIQKSASMEPHKWSENVVNCLKLSIFEGKLQVFMSYLSEMKTVSMFYNSWCSSTFYSLFLPFFVLLIFKFKYDKFFIRYSASISKFEWFQQHCSICLSIRSSHTIS